MDDAARLVDRTFAPPAERLPMKHLVIILAGLTAALFGQESRPEKLPWKLLYAGNAGTPYTAAWQAFLAEHAASVRVVSGSALQATDLAGVDVLIIDGEVESHGAGGELRLKSEKIKLTLDDLQGVPVVLMGGQGGFVSDDFNLKTSWHHG